MNETWTSKSTCLSKPWGEVEQNETGSHHCPPVWDGLSCWETTSPGTTAFSKCPSFKGSDTTKFAFRICGPNGDWLDREGIPSPTGWSNYTPCLTPEILEIMRRLGSDDDAQMKINIAENTRILEFVGLSLSLAALLLSLVIFYYFRTLRNSRTRLHRHLFIAMVIQVAIRLILYTDQAITRSLDHEGNETNKLSSRRGIDNTPILCEASYISLEYARTAMFMWMFVEGLFLHNMITVTVFEEKLSPVVYPMIGWMIPLPLTVAWATVTYLHYGGATCWWGYNFTLYFWILEGPRLAVLMVNLAFLLNILRVLVMKLRQSSSSEAQQAMKAVKAALVLLPLLGLTNILNMLDAPLEKSPLQFALWSYSTHLLTSGQGFVLACLYCFRNTEVQLAIKKFVRVRIRGNSKHILLTRNSIPMSAIDKPLMKRNFDHKNGHKTSRFFRQSTIETSAPLLVRTYSNGVIKQITIRPSKKKCNGVSNGNRSFQKPRPTPAVVPMTTTKEEIDSHSESKRRMLIIPEIFSKCSGHEVDELGTSSSSCKKEGESGQSGNEDRLTPHEGSSNFVSIEINDDGSSNSSHGTDDEEEANRYYGRVCLNENEKENNEYSGGSERLKVSVDVVAN